MVHNCQCVFRTFWSSSSASIHIFAFLLSLISFILILFIFFSWLIVGVMSKLCIYFLSTKNCLRRFCNAIIIITTKMIEFHLLKWNITSTNSINYSKSDFKVIMQSMQHRLVYHKQQKKCEMAGWNLSNIVLNLCWKMCSNLVFSIQPKTFSMMFLFVCLIVSFECECERACERDAKFRPETHFHSFGFDLHISCAGFGWYAFRFCFCFPLAFPPLLKSCSNWNKMMQIYICNCYFHHLGESVSSF